MIDPSHIEPKSTADASDRHAYRQRLYAGYVSQFIGYKSQLHSPHAYHNRSTATNSRIRGWLPIDHSLPVLDLGCGPGYLLKMLEDQGFTDITGVDLSAEQLALAKDHCTHAHIMQADMSQVLAEHPAHYQLITAFSVLEHLDKNELFSLLELVITALRPGGRFIIQTINAENPWGLALLYGDLTHETAFTPGSLAVALRTVGFVDYQARGCPPHVHSVLSLLRKLVWPIFSAAILLESLVETGGTGSAITTRDFVACSVKP
ncbi:MAG: class I SAM-dependent DNA methyltransferase [Anaerolineae bacterium]